MREILIIGGGYAGFYTAGAWKRSYVGARLASRSWTRVRT